LSIIRNPIGELSWYHVSLSFVDGLELSHLIR
jgi:hypothetical protein